MISGGNKSGGSAPQTGVYILENYVGSSIGGKAGHAASMRVQHQPGEVGASLGSHFAMLAEEGGEQPAEPCEPEGEQHVRHKLEHVLPWHGKVVPAWFCLDKCHFSLVAEDFSSSFF